ncbi:MAG: hypothetical protein MUF49_05790 [Oculatellaceae cyanobacterium Prado106]|jgi:hypothetical protein|nr:hypothetical protein [Oculatellaceae cyanobacterium Prado106]
MNVFLSSLLALVPVTALAQTMPTPVYRTCVAIATSGKTQFTYTITLSADSLKPETLSISRRTNTTSSPTSILQNGGLTSFEQDAPDADYSRPPFDRGFRGQPNNGQGIVHYRGSVHGLYVSALPRTEAVQQVQVVHYLSRDGWIKSKPVNCSI